MPAQITFDGATMAGLQPLVGISSQNPEAGIQPTQRIKLEGIIPCGDAGSLTNIQTIVSQNYKELKITDTASGEVATWECAKLIGYSIGGGSEVLGTPYSIEFEAWDDLDSIAQAHGVTDIVSESSYDSNDTNPTCTVTLSCRGIRVCNDSGTDLSDAFKNAKDYIESQAVIVPSEADNGVV